MPESFLTVMAAMNASFFSHFHRQCVPFEVPVATARDIER